jgi:hypothetical protein
MFRATLVRISNPDSLTVSTLFNALLPFFVLLRCPITGGLWVARCLALLGKSQSFLVVVLKYQ